MHGMENLPIKVNKKITLLENGLESLLKYLMESNFFTPSDNPLSENLPIKVKMKLIVPQPLKLSEIILLP